MSDNNSNDINGWYIIAGIVFAAVICKVLKCLFCPKKQGIQVNMNILVTNDSLNQRDPLAPPAYSPDDPNSLSKSKPPSYTSLNLIYTNNETTQTQV
jgi:hypothetical protein